MLYSPAKRPLKRLILYAGFLYTLQTVYTLAAEKSNVLLEKVSQAWYYLFENNMASKNFDMDGVAFISR